MRACLAHFDYGCAAKHAAGSPRPFSPSSLPGRAVSRLPHHGKHYHDEHCHDSDSPARLPTSRSKRSTFTGCAVRSSRKTCHPKVSNRNRRDAYGARCIPVQGSAGNGFKYAAHICTACVGQCQGNPLSALRSIRARARRSGYKHSDPLACF